MRPSILSALLLLCPAAAHAHGAAPSVLSVLAARPFDGGPPRPAILTLTIGAAILQENGVYTYRCPAAWGGEDKVIQAATPDASIHGVLAGASVLRSRGGCVYEDVSLPPDFTPIDLVPLGTDKLAVLAVSPQQGLLLGLRADGPPEPIGTWPLQGDAGLVPDGLLAAGDSVYISGSRPSPGLLRVHPDGTTDLTRLALSPAPQTLLPRLSLPSGLFLSSRTSDGASLLRVAPSEAGWTVTMLASGAQKILGPVTDGDHALAVLDGKLAQVDEEKIRFIADVPYTCLGAVQGQMYACRLGNVSALTWQDGAPPSEQPMFKLTDLHPPEEACGQSDKERDACAGDFSHFGAEAGLLELSAPPASASPETSGGCNTSGPIEGRAISGWVGLLALGVWRRRRA